MSRALFALLLLAAPLAADDKPKPRAKLLGTLKVNKLVELAVWTPDARHLILIAGGKGLVLGREQLGDDTPAKPVAEFDVPAGGAKFGVTPDGTELFAVVSAGARFNAETRMCYWALKDLLEGKKKAKPDRTVDLEADNPTGFALSADGKSLFAVTVDRRPGVTPNGGLPVQAGKVLRLDTKSGDTAETVADLGMEDGTLLGAAVHPETGRVFAQYPTADEHVIRCIDAPTKKRKWERAIDSQGAFLNGQPPKVSPNGKVVVAFVSHQGQLNPAGPPGLPGVGQPGQPGQVAGTRPLLLDAETGKVIAEMGGEDTTACDVCDFSHDGKLLFGWLQSANGMRYTAWDGATGKPLKTWSRNVGALSAAFAPGKHELATVEQVGNGGYQLPAAPNGPGGPLLEFDRRSVFYDPLLTTPAVVPPADTPVSYSIVGVWNLAPLVK
jgi:hypothetical protein